MEENSEQQKKQHKFDWLKAYQWQKGQSGNPGGRPKKTLKTFAREFLESMSEEDRIEYFKTLNPIDVWKMAEGNPKQDVETEVSGSIVIELSEDIAKKNVIDTKPETNS